MKTISDIIETVDRVRKNWFDTMITLPQSQVKSCNCSQCRLVGSGIKRFHKKIGSKRLRLANKRNVEDIHMVSTGYKS